MEIDETFDAQIAYDVCNDTYAINNSPFVVNAIGCIVSHDSNMDSGISGKMYLISV